MEKKEKLISYLNAFIEINILAILFCLPFSKSIVEIGITLAILCFFTKKMVGEPILTVKIDRKVLVALALFVLFSFISIVNSLYFTLSARALFSKVLKWAIFFIIIVDTIKTPRHLKRIFILMLFSCALILVDAFYQYCVSGYDFLHRPPYPVFNFFYRQFVGTTFPTASFPYPNDFAAWINVFLFTFFTLRIFDLRENSPQRIATGVLSFFLASSLFLTCSRAAFLGSAVSAIIILFVKGRRFVIRMSIILLLVLIIIFSVPYTRTFVKMNVLSVRVSYDDRISMWQTGWRIFLQHPFIGNGVNTFFEHFKHFRADEFKYERGSYAHNCFLQMAADIGVLGLISFLSFVIFIIYPSVKKVIKNDLLRFENSFVLGVSLGIITFLVQSFFDTNLYSLNLAALFWLGVGLITAKETDANKNK